jgi:hypothetical protein
MITFARRAEKGGPQFWSEQAKAPLANAPDPKSVLAVFVERFRPMSWSGLRAALIEANARLLDSLEPEVSRNLYRSWPKQGNDLRETLLQRNSGRLSAALGTSGSKEFGNADQHGSQGPMSGRVHMTGLSQHRVAPTGRYRRCSVS